MSKLPKNLGSFYQIHICCFNIYCNGSGYTSTNNTLVDLAYSDLVNKTNKNNPFCISYQACSNSYTYIRIELNFVKI